MDRVLPVLLEWALVGGARDAEALPCFVRLACAGKEPRAAAQHILPLKPPRVLAAEEVRARQTLSLLPARQSRLRTQSLRALLRRVSPGSQAPGVLEAVARARVLLEAPPWCDELLLAHSFARSPALLRALCDAVQDPRALALRHPEPEVTSTLLARRNLQMGAQELVRNATRQPEERVLQSLTLLLPESRLADAMAIADEADSTTFLALSRRAFPWFRTELEACDETAAAVRPRRLRLVRLLSRLADLEQREVGVNRTQNWRLKPGYCRPFARLRALLLTVRPEIALNYLKQNTAMCEAAGIPLAGFGRQALVADAMPFLTEDSAHRFLRFWDHGAKVDLTWLPLLATPFATRMPPRTRSLLCDEFLRTELRARKEILRTELRARQKILRTELRARQKICTNWMREPVGAHILHHSSATVLARLWSEVGEAGRSWHRRAVVLSVLQLDPSPPRWAQPVVEQTCSRGYLRPLWATARGIESFDVCVTPLLSALEEAMSSSRVTS